jgi:hypothetical protein
MAPLQVLRRNKRRGTVIIMATITLAILMAMVALAVDVGYLNNVRTQLQASADSAALAGADTLFDGVSTARMEAERFGESNLVGNTPADIRPPQDIEFGDWDRRALTFTPLVAPDPKIDAVRVTVRRSTTRGNPVTLFFGRALGVNTAELSASAVAQAQHGLCGAIVGIESAHVHGNTYTDSYWSEDSLYSEQTPGSNGHVCSNGTVTLEGGIVINGDVSTVEGQTIDMSTGSPTVNGDLHYRPEDMYAPPIIVGDAATVNDNGTIPLSSTGQDPMNAQGDFKLTGGTVDLPPGTYYFEDFSISGGSSEVTVSGPTIIYVNGTMNLAGQGILNTTQIPTNLQIYVMGPKATVTGGSDFYGTIYAPEADVKVSGNGDFYGALLGKTAEVTPTSTSAGVHYDESVGWLWGARPRAFLVQ